MSHPEDDLITRAMAEGHTAASPGMKISKEHIERKIANVAYMQRGTFSLCMITMLNGFAVTGENGCIDPANYDVEVGKRYAYDNAFEKIWAFEGYLLAEGRMIHGLPNGCTEEPAPVNHEAADV